MVFFQSSYKVLALSLVHWARVSRLAVSILNLGIEHALIPYLSLRFVFVRRCRSMPSGQRERTARCRCAIGDDGVEAWLRRRGCLWIVDRCVGGCGSRGGCEVLVDVSAPETTFDKRRGLQGLLPDPGWFKATRERRAAEVNRVEWTIHEALLHDLATHDVVWLLGRGRIDRRVRQTTSDLPAPDSPFG